MSKFCQTCIHWEKDIFTRLGGKFGICHDLLATDKIIQDRETKLTEDGTTYTAEYFGCIYWRENDGSLININKTLNK